MSASPVFLFTVEEVALIRKWWALDFSAAKIRQRYQLLDLHGVPNLKFTIPSADVEALTSLNRVLSPQSYVVHVVVRPLPSSHPVFRVPATHLVAVRYVTVQPSIVSPAAVRTVVARQVVLHSAGARAVLRHRAVDPGTIALAPAPATG